MAKKSSIRLIISVFWLASSLLTGCNLPTISAPETPPKASPIPPTLQLIPTTIPSPTTAPPTLTAVNPTLTPSATHPPVILQKKLYYGVMVHNRKTNEVQAIDFDGKPLGFKATLTGTDWLGTTYVQSFENVVYYFSSKERQVMRRDAQGVKPLTFIPKGDSIHILISNDQKRIAWSVDSWVGGGTGSELWVADITGTNIKKLLTKDPKNNPKSLVYQPLRWLSNGQLVFVEEPSGIGGYILFYGFAELWIIDPATAKATNLSPPSGKDGLCLKQISPDATTVVSTCSAAPAQLVLYNHTSKTSTQVAVVPDQGQSGSVHYSPNGQTIAYAVARGNADNENGKLVVVPSSGSPVKVIQEVKGGYFNVLGWVDSERILFIRYIQDGGTIFIVNRDGSNLMKIADGYSIGMIPVQ